MSHSYDSTLLQRMGFRDEDRRVPAHDRACIDIATAPSRFLSLLDARCMSGSPRVLLEQPLQKGEGKYATTVGFIDAIVAFYVCGGEKDLRPFEEVRYFCSTCKQTTRAVGRCVDCDEWPNQEVIRTEVHGPRYAYWYEQGVLVEVKTRITAIGDLLRQMNLYREYRKVAHYVVWSLDPSDAEYGPLLTSQGYQLIVGPSLAEARRA